MADPTPNEYGRKDLTDLSGLSRMPSLSFLQKQAQPRAPRRKAATLADAMEPAAFRRIHRRGC
jgi:hypothetical protein